MVIYENNVILYGIIEIKTGDDMSKISQAIRLLIYLQDGNVKTAKELAELLETNPRNIREYIKELRNAGYDIDSFKGKSGGYFLNHKSKLALLDLDQNEHSAILLAHELLKEKSSFVMANEFKSAVSKINYIMGRTVHNYQEFDYPYSAAYVVNSDIQEYSVKDNFLKIHQAYKDKRVIRILYYNPQKDELVEREIEPYSFMQYEGSWYAVAYCRLRNELRHFKLIRIKKIERTPYTYQIDEKFSLEKYREGMMGIIGGKQYDVILKFYPPASTWVEEKKWLPTQKIEQLGNRCILFKAKVKGLVELKRWVLSFGKLVKVIEPKELITELKEELDIMYKRYE